MSQFLKYTDISASIQNRMGSQSPSSTKVLSAVNDTVLEITTEYDLETSKRSVSISVVPDGTTAYNLAVLISDDDLKTVADIRFPTDDDSNEPEFRWIDHDTFSRHEADGINNNEYTTYFEDGVYYIKVNSSDHSSTSVTFDMKYFSYFTAISSGGTLKEYVDNEETDEILLPKRFKKLVTAGALRRLWREALGDDGEAEAAIANNAYKGQLKRLGIDNTGHAIKRQQNKVKIHKPY